MCDDILSLMYKSCNKTDDQFMAHFYSHLLALCCDSTVSPANSSTSSVLSNTRHSPTLLEGQQLSTSYQ